MHRCHGRCAEKHADAGNQSADNNRDQKPYRKVFFEFPDDRGKRNNNFVFLLFLLFEDQIDILFRHG